MFRLTAASLKEIESRARALGIQGPCVSLGRRSQGVPGDEGIRNALTSAKPGEALTEIGRQLYEVSAPSMQLDVFLFEESDMGGALCETVSGVKFALPASALDALAGHVLDYKDDRFVITLSATGAGAQEQD